MKPPELFRLFVLFSAFAALNSPKLSSCPCEKHVYFSKQLTLTLILNLFVWISGNACTSVLPADHLMS